jgi:hypothetical protein
MWRVLLNGKDCFVHAGRKIPINSNCVKPRGYTCFRSMRASALTSCRRRTNCQSGFRQSRGKRPTIGIAIFQCRNKSRCGAVFFDLLAVQCHFYNRSDTRTYFTSRTVFAASATAFSAAFASRCFDAPVLPLRKGMYLDRFVQFCGNRKDPRRLLRTGPPGRANCLKQLALHCRSRRSWEWVRTSKNADRVPVRKISVGSGLFKDYRAEYTDL